MGGCCGWSTLVKGRVVVVSVYNNRLSVLYWHVRVHELCESRGGRPYGFCGRKATLNHA